MEKNFSQMPAINMTAVYIKIRVYCYLINIFFSLQKFSHEVCLKNQLLSTSFASRIFKEPLSPSHSTSLFTISMRFL